MFKTTGLIATVALAGAVLAGPALAGDSNGNFQIKVGGTYADFDNKTNSLIANVPIAGIPAGTNLAALGVGGSAGDTWVPTATLTYYLNKNLAVELFCCAAGTSITGVGPVVGGLNLGHTYVFPPVLTLQYHFDNMGPFRPYVGVGAEWIHFFPRANALGVDLGIKDVFGFAAQAGIDYDLGGGWSLGIDVKKIWANDAEIKWNLGGGGQIVAKHQLDPLYVTANVGYRFNLSDLFSRREPAPLK